MDDSRNPYVILGIPYGAPSDVATRAFARKAKGRRHQRDSSSNDTSLTEMTWALNQVGECIRDPRTAVHVYRVPADPGALQPNAEGVLLPGPELLPRTTVGSSAQWEQLVDVARGEALHAVLKEVSATIPLPGR